MCTMLQVDDEAITKNEQVEAEDAHSLTETPRAALLHFFSSCLVPPLLGGTPNTCSGPGTRKVGQAPRRKQRHSPCLPGSVQKKNAIKCHDNFHPVNWALNGVVPPNYGTSPHCLLTHNRKHQTVSFSDPSSVVHHSDRQVLLAHDVCLLLYRYICPQSRLASRSNHPQVGRAIQEIEKTKPVSRRVNY